MAQRLPPLKAIEAFVSIARTLNFGKASRELNISRSAVCRRLQSLEHDLGTTLFVRGRRSLELTSDGYAYLKLTGPAFDALHQAASMLSRRRRHRTLRVSLPQSFASGWLIPRLSRFYERYPDIELQLDSIRYFESIEQAEADVAIRIAKSPPPLYHADRFMTLEQFPVCNPALLARAPLRAPADLAAHVRLSLTTMPDAWLEWLALVKRPDLEVSRVQEFDSMTLVMQAALDGLGVALGVGALCEPYLRDGRLVAPFKERLQGVRSMYLVCRKPDVARHPIRLLRDWLIAESTS